jgi:methylated-DNA-[protein]-cysteine S-methyltransferase
MSTLNVPSAVGPLTLEEQDGAIVRLGWGDRPDNLPDGTPTPLLAEAARQVAAYFDGTLTDFDLPLAPPGSDYQKRVWRAMAEIPYGETWTYGELARRAETVPRAVGGACGANPIPVILPCHRVVAANGSAGGFSGKGGLKTKSALLDIENPDLRLF